MSSSRPARRCRWPRRGCCDAPAAPFAALVATLASRPGAWGAAQRPDNPLQGMQTRVSGCWRRPDIAAAHPRCWAPHGAASRALTTTPQAAILAHQRRPLCPCTCAHLHRALVARAAAHAAAPHHGRLHAAQQARPAVPFAPSGRWLNAEVPDAEAIRWHAGRQRLWWTSEGDWARGGFPQLREALPTGQWARDIRPAAGLHPHVAAPAHRPAPQRQPGRAGLF